MFPLPGSAYGFLGFGFMGSGFGTVLSLLEEGGPHVSFTKMQGALI